MYNMSPILKRLETTVHVEKCLFIGLLGVLLQRAERFFINSLDWAQHIIGCIKRIERSAFCDLEVSGDAIVNFVGVCQTEELIRIVLILFVFPFEVYLTILQLVEHVSIIRVNIFFASEWIFFLLCYCQFTLGQRCCRDRSAIGRVN